MATTAHDRIDHLYQGRPVEPLAVAINGVRSVAAVEALSGLSMRTNPWQATAAALHALAADLCNPIPLPQPEREFTTDDGFVYRETGYHRWLVRRPDRSLSEWEDWLSVWSERLPVEIEKTAASILANAHRSQAVLLDRCMAWPIIGGPLSAIYNTVGLETFALLMYESGNLLSQLLRNVFRYTTDVLTIVAQNSISPVLKLADDLGAKGGPLISPTWLRDNYFPLLSLACDRVHKEERYLHLHTCGNISMILEDIIEAGVDSIDPVEPTSGMSLTETTNVVAGRIVVMGNMDLNIIANGSSDEVDEEIKRCIREGRTPGPYCFHPIGGFDELPPDRVVTFAKRLRANRLDYLEDGSKTLAR